jgi:hypothetical protein
MAKKSDPAVAGPVFEVEPYVDQGFKPIEVTPYQPVEAAVPVTPPAAPAAGKPESPGAGEKKEN